MSQPDPTAHPRPLLRRPFTSLDGEWGFAADPDLAGTVGAVAFDRTIQVPYAPETPASGISWKGALNRAWYRRRLPGRAGDRRTVLHFGAVDRVCDVWVGGAHVASHEGGYTPFSVDVTDSLGDDGADLVVRADDDPLDLEAPRGKQDWRDEPHEIWYPRTTGIWRTVWLEQVGARHIADVQWRGDPRTMRVDVRVQFAVPVTGARLHLRLRSGERLLVDDVVRVDGAVVERTVQVGDGGFDDRNRLLWRPGPHPALLDAELALVAGDGTVLDEVASYTALRSVEVGDGRLLALLAIDPGGEHQRRRVRHLVRGQDRRAHRAEAVEPLAEDPLAVPLLQVPRGDIVDDGVAEHVAERVRLADAAPALPDDDAELALVVEPAGRIELAEDRLAGGDDRGVRLAEHHGKGRHHVLRAAVEAGPREFLRVLVVVLADAEDVLRRARDRRTKLGAGRLRSAADRGAQPVEHGGLGRRHVQHGLAAQHRLHRHQVEHGALGRQRADLLLHPALPRECHQAHRFLPQFTAARFGAVSAGLASGRLAARSSARAARKARSSR